MKRNSRDTARKRLDARVVAPVSADQRARRSIGSESSGKSKAFGSVGYILAAAGLHGAIVAGLALGVGEDSVAAPIVERVVESVTVRIVDTPEPSPAPLPTSESAATVAPAEPVVEPVEAPTRPTRRSPTKANKRRAKQPPADWVDIPSKPAPASAEPQRRVVGLSFESTVTGGSGTAFAVGNTRMGVTADEASAPGGVEKLRPTGREDLQAPAGSTVSGPNKVATIIPTARKSYTKPKRLTPVQLEYPGILKAQGIEGNVVVLIRVTTEGGVAKVKVIKSSGYSEFDAAARKAAERERFKPATRDGEAIAYSLKYTYRFRIKQS